MAILKPEVNLDVARQHSKAEAKIIEEISKLDPVKTKDWVIYYSYYFKGGKETLSNSNDHAYDHNEIDFLILAPNVGLFVFEIKGGRIEMNNNGVLVSTDENGKHYDIHPYEQAKRNYYAINDRLKRKMGEERPFTKYLSGTLVGFPSIDKIPDVGPKSNGVDTYVRGMNLYSFIIKNAEFLKEKNPGKHAANETEVNEIVKQLEGAEYVYSLSTRNYIESVNLTLNQLTEEQKTIFKGLLANKRCLIKGKAGTGKTILCEFLYKHILEEKKGTVLYLSFNRLIANRVNTDLSGGGESACRPIYDFLEEECRKTIKDFPDFPKFKEKRKYLFEHVKDLAGDEQRTKYDCLIIDEAQDIDATDEMILYLDSLVNHGLEKGRCYIFYDDNQTIFDKEVKKIYDDPAFKDEDSGYRYTYFELTRNCRNSQNVISALDQLLYDKAKLCKLSNGDVQYREIPNTEEGALEVKKVINSLDDDGVGREQITVLSNYKMDNEKNIILKQLKKIFGEHFVEYNLGNKKELTYSTVSAFKGLENDVIIYINNNDIVGNADHYVSLSRAKVKGYVFKVVDK